MANNSTQSCCAGCSNPRTSDDFLKNHVKYDPNPTTDECPVCQEPWNSESLAQNIKDEPMKIVGIDGCKHPFSIGAGCLASIISSGGNTCPFCRTKWYQETNENSELPIWEPPYETEISGMEDRQFDFIATMRPIAYILDEMARNLPSNFNPHLYDPCTNASEDYTQGNPFTFCNWQAPKVTIVRVIRKAWESQLGQRLLDMFHKQLYDLPEWTTEADEPSCIDQVFTGVVDEWIAWYGDEDIFDFTNLFLLFAWNVFRVRRYSNNGIWYG